MGVDEGNLLVMGVERYILTSSSYGVLVEIKETCTIRLLAKSGSINV